MHDLLITRKNLHSFNVTGRRHRNRDHKIAKHIRAAGLQEIGSGHLHDEVRLAKLPALVELRRGRQVCRNPFGSSLLQPLLYGADLRIAESALAGKFAVAGLRQPRRHIAAAGHSGNLPGALFDILIAEQAERRWPACIMTLGAILKDDRGNILVECQQSRRT